MTMALFSQRYNYTPIEKIILRECITEDIENAISSACDMLEESFNANPYYGRDKYQDLERYLWLNFCNKRLSDFSQNGRYYVVLTNVINDQGYPWYAKLDILEMTIRYLLSKFPEGYTFHKEIKGFIDYINHEFERHSYAYRIVGDSIVEITSREECEAIKESICQSPDTVARHLSNALAALAKRPDGDYTNSIKESISAVEAMCRQLTGENTLGKALNALDSKGIAIPDVLKSGIEKIYAYTNNPNTGIRHALMDPVGKYVPGANEAQYMLIVCSAFVNYLLAVSS